jgi:hypothetical protein
MLQPINNHIYLDGKKVASNMVHHLVKAATHATSVAAAPDGHGTFMGPGSEAFG